MEKLVLENLGEEMSGENKKGQLGLEIESPGEIAQKYCQIGRLYRKTEKNIRRKNR